MPRTFKKPEKVLVFDTHEDAKTGKPVDKFSGVALTRHGLDSYRYNGEVYPGFVNDVQLDSQGKKVAFIILKPME